ncbi:hypothetical protein [Flavobacterium sp.]|jgi:hypothetical protein|uniref:hypothetical protein n=1 Tax=Flavobacterium sp. TaxID=239 RepID=UPI00391B038E
MENNETLSESFKRELAQATTSTILDPAYRKKKLVLWAIRTTISVILYVIFWKYNCVKWSLLLTIPLSLFSLFTIIGMPYLLKRKIERTTEKIEETEKLLTETPDE